MVAVRTLLDIGNDIQSLHQLLDEVGGDVTGMEETVDNWLNENQENLEEKLDSYAGLIMEYEAMARVRREEAARINALAKYDDNNADRLRSRLKFFFEAQGLKKVKTKRYNLALAMNGGKAPLILDPSARPAEVDDQYKKITIDFDKLAIRDELEKGNKLPWAVLGERENQIRIR